MTPLPPWAQAIEEGAASGARGLRAGDAVISSRDMYRLLAALRLACETLESIEMDTIKPGEAKALARWALARIAEGKADG